MNILKWFVLFNVCVFVQPLFARTMVSMPGAYSDKQAANSVSVKFAEKGIISSIDPEGQWITINGKKYKFQVMNDKNLSPGMRVFYNFEKAAKEKYGHVTRIWFEKDSGNDVDLNEDRK